VPKVDSPHVSLISLPILRLPSNERLRHFALSFCASSQLRFFPSRMSSTDVDEQDNSSRIEITQIQSEQRLSPQPTHPLFLRFASCLHHFLKNSCGSSNISPNDGYSRNKDIARYRQTPYA